MKEVREIDKCGELLSKSNYSSEVIKEILKWYNCSEKKGIANY